MDDDILKENFSLFGNNAEVSRWWQIPVGNPKTDFVSCKKTWQYQQVWMKLIKRKSVGKNHICQLYTEVEHKPG